MRIDGGLVIVDRPATEGRPGRALVPVRTAPLPVPAETAEPDAAASVVSREPVRAIDVRHLTPREMSDMSMDLYVAGVLTYEEYALLAFQPELHPDYDRTVGALTGEKAEPDKPRDYVREWEDRLDFERSHNADNDAVIDRTRRILSVLRRLDQPTDVLV